MSKTFLIMYRDYCKYKVEINDIHIVNTFRADIDVVPEYLNTEFV